MSEPTFQHARVDFVSGMEALVRLPFLQRQLDAAAGYNTAGFISGYRGSPIGGYDSALWRAGDALKADNIVFQPGLNEELAATAIWGTQQVGLFEGAEYDGVFGLWYGKGPGVDRSVDAMKHANLAGTSPRGGVLALVGDDHGAKSSTTAHQSDQALAAAFIPTLAPADVGETIRYGLLGIAMSRFSGCWAALKLVSDVADSSASVTLSPDDLSMTLPDVSMPLGGLHIRWPDDKLGQEKRMVEHKLPAAQSFARANGVDRIVRDDPGARVGIVASGKAFGDLQTALDQLGLARGDDGLRIYKVGLTWPLERDGAVAFAHGLERILVVEEKRAVVEDQLKAVLYDHHGAGRIRVLGKRDEDGHSLLPAAGELSPRIVAGAVARLLGLTPSTPFLVESARRQKRLSAAAAPDMRREFFCSGCPHNTSTRVPEGSVAIAGIGCHTMASRMPDRRTMTVTQMGGEGASWIGQAHFTKRRHVFQNMGDGTYTHSGFLAIRAAIAAGANITYKLLFNDAVAMTGGQPTEGSLSVQQVVEELAAEGVCRIVVVTDEPSNHAGARLPAGTTVRHRDDLDAVQRELREEAGVTVLLYDQTCAAEKRRRRKRGRMPMPERRVFINEAVCEGCGDCGAKSSCISVAPVDTPFGRKRRIDQSNCNVDLSCLKGFCPSFVTVEGAQVRRQASGQAGLADMPAPPAPRSAPLGREYGILITGIGGTGIVTLARLLGVAATQAGFGCAILDQTGLAQKNGAVMSHVRIGRGTSLPGSARLSDGRADLLLGCDMVVAASGDARAALRWDRSHVVVNDDVMPTATVNFDPDGSLRKDRLAALIKAEIDEAGWSQLNATRLATALCGDAVAANVILLGYALQRGVLPVPVGAVEAAIRALDVAVDANLKALRIGRLAAHDPTFQRRVLEGDAGTDTAPDTLDDLVARFATFLNDYQDEAYAARFRDRVARVVEVERRITGGATPLAETVARSYVKLLAYKDEYEVARLYTRPAFRRALAAQFAGMGKLRVHMAPPLLARRDPVTGHPRKHAFGPWVFPVLSLLAHARRLRGTPLDVFGWTQERRMERRLIGDFEAELERVLVNLSPETHDVAIRWAGIPQRIRGFGHVKQGTVDATRQERQDALREIEAAGAAFAAE